MVVVINCLGWAANGRDMLIDGFLISVDTVVVAVLRMRVWMV